MDFSQAMNKSEAACYMTENCPFDWDERFIGAEERAFPAQMRRPRFVDIVVQVEIAKLHIDVVECGIREMAVL